MNYKVKSELTHGAPMDLLYIPGAIALLIAFAIWYLRVDPAELDKERRAHYDQLYRQDAQKLNSRR